MPRITFQLASGGEVTHDLKCGDSIMEQALARGVPGILGQCGGGITCSTCLCHVPPAWLPRLPPPDPDETELLTLVPEARANSRLSCQIPVTDSLDGLTLRVVPTTPLGE
ncbi:MAG: 2Fe-2S iron-sulfur cluster-binding protein [Pseudomonadales bacterium]|nr:2Fe-2S iron-sulfur cluster-binding protein [Pseudomonadales bacterium]MDP6472335.1 2Fe-2S iron-sulfur cluster-binding protein [Pseudomonadales bacterium]MDP6828131.1 2Fe-2S iron-sulfur cluster-binding protein [Pseudomonadales bacterium]MDP6971829.1 2Fe-2S iron-sulfur cluster-binding protein [Pseudomonadales bacterium]